MKQTKFILLAAGIIGLVACFLPYVKEGPLSMSYWDFHKMPAGNSGLLNGPKQVYVALVCFAAVAAMGGLGMKKLLRWQAIVAVVASLLTLALEGVRKGMTGDHEMHTALGGKLLFIAAIVGIIGGVLGVAKAEQ